MAEVMFCGAVRRGCFASRSPRGSTMRSARIDEARVSNWRVIAATSFQILVNLFERNERNASMLNMDGNLRF